MPYDYFCISQWAPVRQKRHYISSPMKPFRIISLIAVAAMLLAGCRSHKANVSSPHGQWGNGYHDYSSEVTDAMGADLAEEARGWLGTPYRYGGADRRGTDCSGLVMELYRSVCATKLPRTTVEQKSYCTKVARNKALQQRWRPNLPCRPIYRKRRNDSCFIEPGGHGQQCRCGLLGRPVPGYGTCGRRIQRMGAHRPRLTSLEREEKRPKPRYTR